MFIETAVEVASDLHAGIISAIESVLDVHPSWSFVEEVAFASLNANRGARVARIWRCDEAMAHNGVGLVVALTRSTVSAQQVDVAMAEDWDPVAKKLLRPVMGASSMTGFDPVTTAFPAGHLLETLDVSVPNRPEVREFPSVAPPAGESLQLKILVGKSFLLCGGSFVQSNNRYDDSFYVGHVIPVHPTMPALWSWSPSQGGLFTRTFSLGSSSMMKSRHQALSFTEGSVGGDGPVKDALTGKLTASRMGINLTAPGGGVSNPSRPDWMGMMSEDFLTIREPSSASNYFKGGDYVLLEGKKYYAFGHKPGYNTRAYPQPTIFAFDGTDF